MNIPNKLTLSRLILTPFALALFLLSYYDKTLSDIAFTVNTIKVVLASLLLLLMIYMEVSDLVDGKIARKYHLVTDLGKVFDPFSDMFMHLTMFFAFTLVGDMPFVAFIIMLWRELLMLLMRMLLSSKSVSFPANIFGKSKTVFFSLTTFYIIVYNLVLNITGYNSSCMIADKVMYILGYISAFLSFMSFVIYLVNIKKSHILDSITK